MTTAELPSTRCPHQNDVAGSKISPGAKSCRSTLGTAHTQGTGAHVDNG
jgi:hypothetical protein